MKRALLILFTACSVASAQTFITVTADTNRVIRTNFSLVRSQVTDLSAATYAISNITGLQTALDGKLATNGTLAISNITSLQSSLDGKLATSGSAAGLTNFPAIVLKTNSSDGSFPLFLLRTNGSAAELSNFPASVLLTNSSVSSFPQGLLRTNGDGSALTNLPNANLSNAIGVLPISNGGTGSTNESSARSSLGLGSAATNNASAFQPASTALTNLAGGDASGLTNIANTIGVLAVVNGGSGATNAEGARTNFGLVWGGLTNADAIGFRAALSLGTAATNDASAFQPSSANLTNLAANNGGSLTNVSVDLTAVLPSYSGNDGKVLAVATGGTNVAWTAISNTVTDASTLTNFPSIILQTNSAEGSFQSFLLRTNGSANGLTNFPAIVLQTNSSESAFPQVLLRTNGNGSSLTNITAAYVTGTVALASNVTGTVALATNVSGTVAITNGGTGATTVSNARINLFPSYTGNETKVLTLNSNATDVLWSVVTGASVNFSNTNNTGIVAIANGGTGSNSATGALTSLGVIGIQSVTLGLSSSNTSANVVIGENAKGYSGSGVAVGRYATTTNNGVAVGYQANASGNGAAVGYQATNTSTGAAVGYQANTTGTGASVGLSTTAINGFAGGANAKSTATNSIQLGSGTNGTENSVQIYNAGIVDTNEWSRIAALSTYPTTSISVVGTGNTNTLVFSNGILVEVQ